MLGEVIDARPAVEKVSVLLFGASTFHLQSTAAKLCDKVRAIAGTGVSAPIEY